MANHLQDPLTTFPKPSPIKEDTEYEERTVSLQAETILTNVTFSMVFKTALELGVIDTIAAVDQGVWLSSSEIALRLPVKPTNPEAPVLLERMLVLLVTHSILKYRLVQSRENNQTVREFAAEPICMFFLNRGDGSGSLAPRLILALSEASLKPWTHFKDMILEGNDAFTSAHGLRLFDYIASNKLFREMFNRGISERTILIMKKVLEVYKGFEGVNTLVDVGGGTGTVLGLVTSKYPHIKGINFDIAAVLSNAPLYPGVEHISGDMFTKIPKGDAIIMKSVLHAWSDEDCIKILKNCWKSVSENGKLILLDMIKPEELYNKDPSSKIVLSMDITMLTQCYGGKERSFAEIKTLAFASGFLGCEVICHAYSYSMIELHK